MIVSKTPFRISIGGGGTDLPFYYTKKGGALTTATIDKYMYIIVQKRQFDEYLIRYSKTETVKKVDDIKHELVREALKLLDIKDHIEITSVSDFPAQTGLGSSSAYLVGLLNALHAYKGERVSKKTLAEEATKIQMDLDQGAGLQDQYAAAFGGLIHLSINKKGKVIVNPLDISVDTIKKLEEQLVFFYTRIRRDADEVLKDQKKEAEKDERKIEGLTQIKRIGRDIKKALESGNTRKMGILMDLHWEAKKKLSSKMTSSQIDQWYELGIKNGASGGKIVGAGGGGFLMFFVNNNKEQFIKSMKDTGLVHMPLKFEHDGTKIIVEDWY